MNGVTPYLTIGDGRANEAVDFYKRAFDAEELGRHAADDGRRLMHAHLRINGADLMLSDHFPEHCGGAAAPTPAGVTLHLVVDDSPTNSGATATASSPTRSATAGRSARRAASRIRGENRRRLFPDVMLNLFQHPIRSRAAGWKMDPETSSG